MEIMEILESNSGKDPFPAFLKRGPLPKVGPPWISWDLAAGRAWTSALLQGTCRALWRRALLVSICRHA